MFNSVYPALEELKQPLTPDQLNVLRNQLESEEPKPSPQTRFNYAWGLIKSNSHKQQREGLEILTSLYKTETSMRREILYYLSLVSFKIGDYTNAKRYIEALLKIEPHNSQASQLKENIEEKITQEGLIGIGIAGGVLAIGIGLIGALVRKNRK
ncbi:FIS1 [Candida jiufengensis]|uniref:FIS1 n=1 Tax=Candida jiufengensis TaxID=497108 RepID=UPI002224DD36|nr:FIS1 [Candida jiufengensis]KAI5950107.1 FIS1 [Candida jiufengensis]